MVIAQILEAVMLICFGLSWPLNAYKNFKAETAAGSSWQFILLITMGYVAGIIAKFASGAVNWVLIVYFLNLACLGVNWCVYFRNCRLDREHILAAAHEHEEASIGNLLIATDGSQASLAAINFAAHSINLEHVDEINVVSVANPSNAASCKRARNALDTAKGFLDEVHVNCKTEMLHGRAATAIVKTAKDKKANLVVMGSRGYSGMRSLLLGSVSKEVCNSAACPVLVVKRARIAPGEVHASVPGTTAA